MPERMRSLFLDLRYRAEYLGLRLIAGLVRTAPLDVAGNVSAKIWRVIAPYDRRHKRALQNLAIAFPEKSPKEREAIALAMWGNLGRVMTETMQLDRIIAEPDRIQLVDASARVFERYQSKMGAAIGVTLHMGNWELAVWPLTVAGNNPAAVYRTVKNPYVDKYLRRLRKDLYPGGLLGKGRINDTVDEGRTDRPPDHGLCAPRRAARPGLRSARSHRDFRFHFLAGRPNPSPYPAMIARRVGARIWMGRCLRVGNQCRFTIELKELKVPRTANAAEDVKWVTAAMQAQFEAWVRDAPEQWMWSNRRWG